MTPTTLAAAILRDVKRYSLTQLGPVEGGQWLHYPDVIRALTAAMDPAIAERAGEVLEGVSDGAWKVVRNRDKTLNVVSGADADGDTHKICLVNGADEANARFIAWCREGVPALLAQNAALRAERDEALEWLSASQGYIADAVFALDKQEKAEAKLAAMEAIATQWKARAERLEAALHRIQEGRYGRAAAIARTALKGDDHE